MGGNIRKIRLEASSVCQLKCPSCPNASGAVAQGLGAGFLTPVDFRRFLDANPSVSLVELSNWGEIFLNPDLPGILHCAYQKNVALTCANGANLNTVRPQALEALVRYRFRQLAVSLDGAGQETYAAYRRGGDFNKVIAAIETINHYKQQYRSPFPRLKWQFIIFGHNETDIPAAREKAAGLGMDFSLKLSWGDLYGVHGREFSPVRDRAGVGRATGLYVGDRDEYLRRYGREYIYKKCCAEMWNNPQINFDGRFLGCSVNYWGDYGNAFRDGLAQCLGSEKLSYARGLLLGRNPERADIPCLNCNIYQRMKANHDWLDDEAIRPEYAPGRAVVAMENRFPGPHWTAKGIAAIDAVKGLWKPKMAPLKSGVMALRLPLAGDERRGWKAHPVFSGRAAVKGVKTLGCHVSVLHPGRWPHPPHIHPEEEVLLVLSGEVNLVVPDADSPEGLKRFLLPSGGLVYYPAGFGHTIETAGAEPAHYLMFKWEGRTRKSRGTPLLEFGTFDLGALFSECRGKKGFATKVVFEGPTAFLKKGHCHLTELAPGAGYPAHADAYDVAIVLLQGEVETLGCRAQAHDVIFYRRGDPHAMRNPGPVPARYVVFEFH